MLWYEFAVPALVVALLVRLDAIAIGPYWSWIEMLSELGDDRGSGRQRRAAFARRIALPGIVGFVLIAFWPGNYTPFDTAWVGAAGAGLLLWPLLFHGPPWGVSTSRLSVLYSSLAIAFSACGWFGGAMAGFAHAEGGLWAFVQDNVFSIAFGGVLTLFSGGALTRVSAQASQGRMESGE